MLALRRPPVLLQLATLLVLVSTPALAQDSLRFAILKGSDTVAIEVARRVDVTWKGTLTILRTPAIDMVWSAVTDDKGLTPLVEITVMEQPTDPRMKARIVTRNRLIMRGDSVSVDAMTSNGLVTQIFPMAAGAMPYLNLSFGMLDLAVRRLLPEVVSGEPISIPFFNLSGGQSATGKLVRKDKEHAALTLGEVTMQLALRDGAIVRVAIPEQDLVAVRVD